MKTTGITLLIIFLLYRGICECCAVSMCPFRKNKGSAQ